MNKVLLGDSWDGLKEQFVWKERTGPFVTNLACNLGEEISEGRVLGGWSQAPLSGAEQ